MPLDAHSPRVHAAGPETGLAFGIPCGAGVYCPDEATITATPCPAGSYCAGCNETLWGDFGYRGCQTATRSGITCQKWSDTDPHDHDRTTDNFPGQGLGDHNYCRNPDGEETIWCYTIDPDWRWDLCHGERSRLQ